MISQTPTPTPMSRTIPPKLMASSTDMMILKLLEQEDMYGYRIIREIAARSKDTFKLNEGTLYPILHMLEKEGHLTSYDGQSETGRSRRYYHITTQGQLHLTARMEEWHVFSDAVSLVLKPEGV